MATHSFRAKDGEVRCERKRGGKAHAAVAEQPLEKKASFGLALILSLNIYKSL